MARKGGVTDVVVVKVTPEPEVTVPTGEECTVTARIYHERRDYPGDIKRMCKQGWQVVSVREQRMPLWLERVRADCPGALTRISTQELIVFYRRCGHPSNNRVKRIAMRFRGETGSSA